MSRQLNNPAALPLINPCTQVPSWLFTTLQGLQHSQLFELLSVFGAAVFRSAAFPYWMPEPIRSGSSSPGKPRDGSYGFSHGDSKLS